MRKVLLGLLVLAAVVLVLADRFGVRTAENKIGEQVAAQYNLQERPEVTIHGIPFLTQAIGGEYKHIEVAIGDWTEQGVTVTGVKVDMRGVSAPLSEVTKGNAANVTARTATASAVVPYDVIKKEAPKEVKRIGPKGDDLSVDMTGNVLGVPVNGTAVVQVKPTSKGIAVTPVSVGSNGAQQIPLALVKQQLTWVVPVADLPVGSRISEIQPTPDGLRVSATAENVRLNDLQQK
ncbi:LmeA family phospholipid-binding protein [Spirillospora sp. CA-142024]|uniref:LmeA family phospholipid-binding protein n=1 Tax=Spirillospora sp. CA-142024 TaxID=3240036 RepID=UPI003D8B81BD